MTPITDMKTSDMVAEYNALTGKSIKKFSSRAAGEKQLTQARAEKIEAMGDDELLEALGVKPPAKSLTRADGVRKSWSDKNTHDLRSARHRVAVNGVEYRSVRAAFTALDLPLSKHIKFRSQLKAAKVLAWNDKFQFSLVAAD